VGLPSMTARHVVHIIDFRGARRVRHPQETRIPHRVSMRAILHVAWTIPLGVATYLRGAASGGMVSQKPVEVIPTACPTRFQTSGSVYLRGDRAVRIS
jgi:hypothetical protein